jgi:hypothetical protein
LIDVAAQAGGGKAMLTVDHEQLFDQALTARHDQRLAEIPVPGLGDALDQQLACLGRGVALIAGIDVQLDRAAELQGGHAAERGVHLRAVEICADHASTWRIAAIAMRAFSSISARS